MDPASLLWLLFGNGLLMGSTAVHAWVVATRLQHRPALAGFLLALNSIIAFIAPPFLVDASSHLILVQTVTCILGVVGFKLAALAMRRGVAAAELRKGVSFWRFAGSLLLPVIPIYPPDSSTLEHIAKEASEHSQDDSPEPDTHSQPHGSLNKSVNNSFRSHASTSSAGSSRLAPVYRPYTAKGKLQAAAIKLATFAVISLGSISVFFQVAHHPGVDDGHPNPLLVSAQQSGPAWWQAAKTYLLRPLFFYFSGLLLWLQIEGMGDLLDAVALTGFGITAEPHFNMPVAATSMAQFWTRWNMTMSSLLREAVYQPIAEGRLLGDPLPQHPHTSSSSLHHTDSPPKPLGPVLDATLAASNGASESSSNASLSCPAPGGKTQKGATETDPRVPHSLLSTISGQSATMSGMAAAAAEEEARLKEQAANKTKAGHQPSYTRKLLGIAATFLVSGLWHELVFLFISGGSHSRGIWTLFFLIQAPVIAAENPVRRAINTGRIKAPKWARVVYVNVMVCAALSTLWVPPMLWRLPEPAPWAAAPHVTALSKVCTTNQLHVPSALRVAANVSQSAFFPEMHSHHHQKYDQKYELSRQQCEAAGAAHTGSCPATFSSAPPSKGSKIRCVSAPSLDDGGRGASWPTPPPEALINRPASGQHAPYAHGSDEALKSAPGHGPRRDGSSSNDSATPPASSNGGGKSDSSEEGHSSGTATTTIHKDGKSSILERIMNQTFRDLAQLQELAAPLIRVAQSVMPAQVVAGWAESS